LRVGEGWNVEDAGLNVHVRIILPSRRVMDKSRRHGVAVFVIAFFGLIQLPWVHSDSSTTGVTDEPLFGSLKHKFGASTVRRTKDHAYEPAALQLKKR